MAATSDAVEEDVRVPAGSGFSRRNWAWVAEPGDVEIDLVGHRVVQLGIFIAEVLHGKPGVALEGHWPVGVEAAVRVDGDHRGTDLSKPAPAVGEEVPERDLQPARMRVPVGPEHQRPPVVGVGGEPDVGDRAGPSIVAIGKVVPAPMITDEDSFQPSPRSRAA